MNDRTTAYFDDLVERAATAVAIPRAPWAGSEPNQCHANCEAYVARHLSHDVVRGWLAIGGRFFIPHSVVRDRVSGNLIDITPDPSKAGAIPFVEHRGTEEDFCILRIGRNGGWLHPPANGSPADFAAALDVSP
jgi:hypothetical protein